MSEGKPPADSAVKAATIGAVAVVVAACVQVFGGGFPSPAPTPTASPTPSPTLTPTPTPTPPAAPLADPVGPLHEIQVANDCDKPFRIMFHYHGPNGWTNNDGAYWRYDRGEDDRPTFDDKPLMTDRPDIYIFGRLLDDSQEWAGKTVVMVKGIERGFRPATIEQRINGDYAVQLACTDKGTPTPTPSPTPTPGAFTQEMLDDIIRGR